MNGLYREEKSYRDDDIIIAGAGRSIVGSESGSLKDLPPVGVGAAVLEQILTRMETASAGFSRNQTGQIIIGHCIGAGTGQNLPRQIASRCGMDRIESAFVVNEMCGSGLESLILAARTISSDEYSVVIAGGIEMPSAAPWLITTRQLIDWKDRPVGEIQEDVVRSDMFDALWCEIHGKHTIVHAENTTAEWVERKKLDPAQFKLEIDSWAVESHRRAVEAGKEGRLRPEIVVIPGTSPDDELPRIQKLERLQKRQGTRYTPNGFYLSNQNSPPLADCAAFLVLMKYSAAREYGFTPLGRIIAFSRAGVEPEKYLLAPLLSTRRLLDMTGLGVPDFDLLELNSAFGSQMIINRMELGLDMEKVNIYGDCIAFGHPIGAAGARLTITLLSALSQRRKRLGMVGICLGGGNALSLAVERIGS